MFSIFSTTGLSSAETARLRRIEGKLDLILDHLGLTYLDPTHPDSLPADVRSLADAGRKIHAIRALREQTGSSLAEAKNSVETYLDAR